MQHAQSLVHGEDNSTSTLPCVTDPYLPSKSRNQELANCLIQHTQVSPSPGTSGPAAHKPEEPGGSAFEPAQGCAYRSRQPPAAHAAGGTAARWCLGDAVLAGTSSASSHSQRQLDGCFDFTDCLLSYFYSAAQPAPFPLNREAEQALLRYG